MRLGSGREAADHLSPIMPVLLNGATVMGRIFDDKVDPRTDV